MFLKPFLIAFAALALAGCNIGQDRDPGIGEAFVGPATLNLRKDIDPKAPVAGVVHHGDRLEILGQRRRWYRVRTPKGAEGWTDDRQLMDTAQMNRLRALSKGAADLPSQGIATAFDVLNVHTEPNRQSASFLQVAAGEKFDVVAHRVLPRTRLPKRQLVVPRPKSEGKKGKKKGQSSLLPPLPPPVPPGPPPDWVALSKERSRAPEENLPPAAQDDWTLIRTHAGQSGWVLTSRVYMAIPDEVAQYAEGHRITSYFQLGKVDDGGEQKPIWLWTTATGLGEDHDFDGYRVFTWNTRRHRYETAYIQRRERGFFPVLAKTGEFSVCLEREDGVRIRKQYTLVGNAVRAAGERPCEKPQDENDAPDDATTDNSAHITLHSAPPPKVGFLGGLKARVKGLFGK
ncbi:MAG: hypothetical protein QOJ99_5559 [Bryobacterales bacterium]|nr:hypothetical protein [Bryobacterales bacterium]